MTLKVKLSRTHIFVFEAIYLKFAYVKSITLRRSFVFKSCMSNIRHWKVEHKIRPVLEEA